MAEGIILAGGKSTRMNTNKLLLDIAGHPVIWHTIKSVSPFVSRIIIVTGKYHDELAEALKDENVTIVHNLNYEKGMFSSVLAGVKETKEDFFVVPGDCPFISKETYLALLNGKGDIRVPRYNGEDGHPIYISKKYKDELLSLSLDFNLKSFRDSKNYEIIDVSDKNIANNLNNYFDYQNICNEKGR